MIKYPLKKLTLPLFYVGVMIYSLSMIFSRIFLRIFVQDQEKTMQNSQLFKAFFRSFWANNSKKKMLKIIDKEYIPNPDDFIVQEFFFESYQMVDIALFEPEIPHNTGALMRLCSCLNVTLHLIEPLGFVLSNKHLKRAGMDYKDKTTLVTHDSFSIFQNTLKKRRLILLDTKGTTSLYDFCFQDDDVLLFGKESCGVPPVIAEACDEVIVIAMESGFRSLNLALSAAMTLGEALRQTRFKVL